MWYSVLYDSYILLCLLECTFGKDIGGPKSMYVMTREHGVYVIHVCVVEKIVEDCTVNYIQFLLPGIEVLCVCL